VTEIIGWIIWGVVAFLALGWAYGCRNMKSSGQPPQWGTVVLTLFLWVIVIFFLVSGANKLHILWAAPVAFVLSFVISPPMGIPLLSPIVLGIAQAFMAVVTIGVEQGTKDCLK
jgi:hypothetical protein